MLLASYKNIVPRAWYPCGFYINEHALVLIVMCDDRDEELATSAITAKLCDRLL